MANPKDFAKKKRANRSAKLKQCKLDARREQWLSQVKNIGEPDGRGGCYGPGIDVRKESVRSTDNLGIHPEGERSGVPVHHYSDTDSPSNSPTSHASSLLGSDISGTNFSGSSGGSSSSSSGGSCSGSITGEDEEGDGGCFDNWEAIADALASTGDQQELHNPNLEFSVEHESMAPLDSPPELGHRLASGLEISHGKRERMVKVHRAPSSCRAWKPDDAFRPQSLPSLSKQLSLPLNSDGHLGCGGGGAWGCQNAISAPSSCPICCENLDLTDSSFLPCSCGFKLCLFCHKRILEEDGRCPGCRKQYDQEPIEGESNLDRGTFRLARSCSMVTRS